MLLYGCTVLRQLSENWNHRKLCWHGRGGFSGGVFLFFGIILNFNIPGIVAEEILMIAYLVFQ